MSHKDEFGLDNDFNEDDDEGDQPARFIMLPDRKKPGRKSPQAAWSRVEDLLAERRLARELNDYLDADDV